MEFVSNDHGKLVKNLNLAKSIDDVQACIDHLSRAREKIATGESHSISLMPSTQSYVYTC